MNAWSRHWRLVRALLAVLLLASRLAMAAPGLPMADPSQSAGFAGLLGDVPICHGDPGPAAPASKPGETPPAPAHDCALCPICHAAAAPALLCVAAWLPPPPPRVGTTHIALPPPSTGPPRGGRSAASPRGPPASAV